MRDAAIAYSVAIIADHGLGGEMLEVASNHADSSRLWGSTIAISVYVELDEDGATRARLRVDEDLTVRLAEDYEAEPAARFWSCEWCRSPNAFAHEECSECGRGNRSRRRSEGSRHA